MRLSTRRDPLRATHLVRNIVAAAMPMLLASCSGSLPTAQAPVSASDAVAGPTSSPIKLESPAPYASTDVFSFYSRLPITLHHFLYHWARAEIATEEGRPARVPVPEIRDWPNLEPEEQAEWRAALDHYREELGQRDLLFDVGMVTLANVLTGLAPEGTVSEDIDVPMALGALAAVESVYRRHWWWAHHKGAEARIESFVDVQRNLEPLLALRHHEAYGTEWPEERIPVDVLPHANWAGAFTTVRPSHITLSSTDPDFEGRRVHEILFHEASHAVFMPGLRAELRDAFATLDAEPPRDLGHVIVFQTSGEITRRAAARYGEHYITYAEHTGLYRRARSFGALVGAVDEHWLPVVRKGVDRQEALAALAAALIAQGG